MILFPQMSQTLLQITKYENRLSSIADAPSKLATARFLEPIANLESRSASAPLPLGLL